MQRAKFTGELQDAAHTLGDSNPENASSISGTLHRGWINIRTAVMGHDRHGLLAECERGEDVALAEYQKVLAQELPANLRDIIEKQHSLLAAAHARVKALRDTAAPAAA